MALSDLSDRQATMKCFGTAHQFLSKPADAPTLASAFAGAFAYETWLPGEKVRKLLAQLSKLPSPPRLYFQVVKELRSPDVSLENIGAMISKDPAITAEILQRVNSVLFGLSRTVANLSEAALFPGVDTTRSVILLPHSFSCFDQISTADFSIDPLWQLSIRTGNFARWIAGTEDANKALGDESYTAGMLHDIGKLVPAANVPDQFSEAAMMARSRAGAVCAKRRRPSWRPATQNWAACLPAIGGLPLSIVEAVALHHHPARLFSKTFGPLTSVHAANAIEPAESSNANSLPVDADSLSELNLDQRLPVWWKTYQQKGKAAKDE